MATNTTNYGLVKPDLSDFYDVNVQNQNMDKIDENLKKIDDKIDNIPTPDVSGQINEHDADETAHGNIRTAIASKAPMYSYGTEDLEAGVTPLESGKLHFVYE